MRSSCIPAIAMLFCSGFGLADEPKSGTADPGRDELAMETVLVKGEQPGPALWRVTSGDHVLWILGEVSPVALKVKWRTRRFERALAESQEALLETGQIAQACRQQPAGVFRPQDVLGGSTLRDFLSPEMYSRVQIVSDIYGERDKIEKLHPHAAITLLANSATSSLKLRMYGTSFAVDELARKADVRVTWIPLPCLEDENFRPSEITVPCLERLLDTIDDGGSGLRRLANAWSIGDIDELRHLVPSYAFVNESHQPSKCMVAGFGSEQRANAFVAKRTASWLNEAERVLRENRSTMAVVPMSEIFAPDGYLAALRTMGYEVVEPE